MSDEVGEVIEGLVGTHLPPPDMRPGRGGGHEYSPSWIWDLGYPTPG